MRGLALALGWRDKDSESIQVYQTATKLVPKELDLQVNLALRLSDVGEREKAIAQMRKALKVSPPHLLGSHHGLLAAMLEDVGRHDEALNTFEKAIRLSPEDTPLCYNAGRRFLRGKDSLKRNPFSEKCCVARQSKGLLTSTWAWRFIIRRNTRKPRGSWTSISKRLDAARLTPTSHAPFRL
jgi:tetratricopeptide (TPR) repeat protein